MNDRAAPRTRTLLRARIEYNGGAATVDCTVRDLSDTGARLEVADSVVLPPHFILFIPKQNRRHTAELRWHRDGFVGVHFIDEMPSENAGELEADERIAKLEAENARMRRLIEAIRADPSQARLLVERFTSGLP